MSLRSIQGRRSAKDPSDRIWRDHRDRRNQVQIESKNLASETAAVMQQAEISVQGICMVSE